MNDISNSELSINELKKHLNNIINALIALCPTRNYISQFLMALPEEYAMMYDSFPEFLSDKVFRAQLQTVLGLELGPQIQYMPNSFAESLITLIKLIFNIFANEKWLQISNALLGDIRSDKIPNLFQEWILAKLKLAINDPLNGKNVFLILKTILENQFYTPISNISGSPNNTITKRDLILDDLIVKLQLSKTELEEIIHFLAYKLKIIQIRKQKDERDFEYDVIALADSVNMEWLKDLLQKNSPQL